MYKRLDAVMDANYVLVNRSRWVHEVPSGKVPGSKCAGVIYGESNRGQASPRTTIQRMCQPQEEVQIQQNQPYSNSTHPHKIPNDPFAGVSGCMYVCVYVWMCWQVPSRRALRNSTLCQRAFGTIMTILASRTPLVLLLRFTASLIKRWARSVITPAL